MKCNNTLCKRHLSNGECVKLVGEECKYEQAKEIIKIFLQLRNGNVLDCCRDKECPCDNPVCENINKQAEQFLKEIEK